jgi:hypothetical protein
MFLSVEQIHILIDIKILKLCQTIKKAKRAKIKADPEWVTKAVPVKARVKVAKAKEARIKGKDKVDSKEDSKVDKLRERALSQVLKDNQVHKNNQVLKEVLEQALRNKRMKKVEVTRRSKVAAKAEIKVARIKDTKTRVLANKSLRLVHAGRKDLIF